jgi:hypothetical protein
VWVETGERCGAPLMAYRCHDAACGGEEEAQDDWTPRAGGERRGRRCAAQERPAAEAGRRTWEQWLGRAPAAGGAACSVATRCACARSWAGGWWRARARAGVRSWARRGTRRRGSARWARAVVARAAAVSTWAGRVRAAAGECVGSARVEDARGGGRRPVLGAAGCGSGGGKQAVVRGRREREGKEEGKEKKNGE